MGRSGKWRVAGGEWRAKSRNGEKANAEALRARRLEHRGRHAFGTKTEAGLAGGTPSPAGCSVLIIGRLTCGRASVGNAGVRREERAFGCKPLAFSRIGVEIGFVIFVVVEKAGHDGPFGVGIDGGSCATGSAGGLQ